MFASLNRKLVAAIAVVALAALAGGAYAATSSSGPSSRQAFLNDVARRLHVTPQQLTAALNGASVDRLNAAVAAGKLTQAQADALEKRIQQGGSGPVGPLGFWRYSQGPRLFHLGSVPYGPLRPGAPGAPAKPGAPALRGAPGGRLDAAATYLGVSEQKLFSELASGKTLAQLAKQAGKPASGLKAAMTAAVKAKLDKAVSAKLITSTQESRILSNLSARLDDVINGTFPRRPLALHP